MKLATLFILSISLILINAGIACTDPCSSKGGNLKSYYDSKGTTPIGTYKCICTWTCEAWNKLSNSCVGAATNNCPFNIKDMDSGYTVQNTTGFDYNPYPTCKPASTYCDAICKSGCTHCLQ
jgi:hypothetical protein